jgi:ComF family protein
MGSSSALVSLALDLMGDLVAPSRCAACDSLVRRLAAFCPACAATVEREPIAADARDVADAAEAGGDGDTVEVPEEHAPIAAFGYGGAVAVAITRMKYDRRPDLARPLGHLFASALASRVTTLEGLLVVPVPLHPLRLAERGFNQSALLARHACARLGGDFAPRALVRVRDTDRQASLDRAGRLRNVEDAFLARRPERVQGRRVLLVDDVATTGATLRACAQALRNAGALEVASAVVARAHREGAATGVSSALPP